MKYVVRHKCEICDRPAGIFLLFNEKHVYARCAKHVNRKSKHFYFRPDIRVLSLGEYDTWLVNRIMNS